jgi:hypothetical protein
MTEKERKENQRFCIDCCRREGWMDEQFHLLWPEDAEARAEMGRGLFGLALTNALDSIFINWRERASNPEGRTGATPGSIADRRDQYWRRGLASMTQDQRDFVLRVIDDVLNSMAYHFGIMLDRFDHGDLSLHLTALDDQREPKFTVQIQPQGALEMFQDVLEWRERFGRGAAIGRPSREDEKA